MLWDKHARIPLLLNSLIKPNTLRPSVSVSLSRTCFPLLRKESYLLAAGFLVQILPLQQQRFQQRALKGKSVILLFLYYLKQRGLLKGGSLSALETRSTPEKPTWEIKLQLSAHTADNLAAGV